MLSLHKLAGGVAATALTLAMASAVHAQETTSAIRGEVVDSSGAPVEGAQVTILHQPSGTRADAVTGPDGLFSARNLRVGGPYLITVEGTDFETETLEGINLTLAETTRLNFEVVGAGEVEAVVVTARRDPTADNNGITTTLDRDAIDAVVSNNRDIRDLARRNLLVSQNTRGDGGISIAGSNPRTNRITIDGAQAQDDFGLNTGGQQSRRGPISLDGIEQFTIDAVPIDVENGDFLGGAINIVSRSGGNDFTGSLFLNYLNDGMVGDSIRDQPIRNAIRQENYGGFLGGPIVRDRLFFALNYETYETSEQTTFGPAGQGFANDIANIAQADIDRVIATFNDRYAADYDVGTIPRSTPIIDEKYYFKFDANINDNNRLSFTQRYTNSEATTRTGLGRTSAGLSSQYYLSADEVYAYALELNSTITNDLTTQIRITHKDNERRQEPLGGAEFAEVGVCSAPTGVNAGGDSLTSCGTRSPVNFGADQFRQANFLNTDITEIQAKAEYSLGDHLFKVGYQGQKTDIFNIFVPQSDGVYYFDSIDQFSRGQANQLRYSNAITGNAEDAAAAFQYYLHSLLAQDVFDVTDTLRFTAGVRLDIYQQEDAPAFNQNFQNRNGFSNQKTYDGLSVFQPRFSVEWEPLEYLEVRGGFGLFSGGIPDVFISNSFSNTGVLSAGVDIRRNADGTFSETTGTPGFTQAIGAAALNVNLSDPRAFYDIPDAVLRFQQGATVSPTAEVNAISPGFQFPADYKFFFNTVLEAPDGWSDSFAPNYLRPALEGWRLTLDAVITRADEALLFRDFRAQPLIVAGAAQRLPDGRIRYDGLAASAVQRTQFGITSANPGSNRDIVAINTERGESYTAGFTLSREFDNGLGVLFGYARQNLEDQTSGGRFASTASSLYGTGPAGLDPNEEEFGTGFEEIRNRYKFEANYRRAFFRDLESRFTLFGDIRSGRPISFVMSDVGGGRGSVFGVNRANHLLFVPDIAADVDKTDLNVGLVTFDSVPTRDNFLNAVNLFGLSPGIQQKGAGDENPEIYQLDFQYSQQLPGFRGGRTRIVFDLQNVLNLLNNEWGIVEEYADTNRVVSVQCATAAGLAAPTGSPVCDRYRYSNFNPESVRKAIDSNLRSLWQLQIALRYEF